MLTFDDIDRLVNEASRPLDDEWLEDLNSESENYPRFLYLLVKALKPKLSLEIGTFAGKTTAHLCAAATKHDGQVVGIDLNGHALMDRLLARYDNLSFKMGDTTHIRTARWVHELVEKYGPIGVVYQDSSHHYWASRIEWDFYLSCLDDFTVWLCDDITDSFHSPKFDPPERGMVQFFDELPGEKKKYPDILHKGNTQGIILVTSKIRDTWVGWYPWLRREELTQYRYV